MPILKCQLCGYTSEASVSNPDLVEQMKTELEARGTDPDDVVITVVCSHCANVLRLLFPEAETVQTDVSVTKPKTLH